MKNIEEFDTAWITLTYNCNNRCKWCYSASNTLEGRANFPTEKEDEVLNLLDSLGLKRIILIGGEPTMYQNINRIIEKISDKGMRVGLISNGRKFRDYDFSRKIRDAGLDYLTISIAGPNSETHDSLTKIKGSFVETIQGIKSACGVGIDTATNTVIGKNNSHILEGIVDSLIGLPIQEMTFNICGVCLSEESNNYEILPPQESVSAFERVHDYAKTKGIRARLVTPMPLCLFKYSKELKESQLISGGPCQLVYGKNFVIEYNGDIVPCTHLAHYPMMNIFQDDKVISKDEFLREYNKKEGIPYKFREAVRKYPSAKCDDCNENCSGGCPIFWTKFNPDKEIKGTISSVNNA